MARINPTCGCGPNMGSPRKLRSRGRTGASPASPASTAPRNSSAAASARSGRWSESVAHTRQSSLARPRTRRTVPAARSRAVTPDATDTPSPRAPMTARLSAIPCRSCSEHWSSRRKSPPAHAFPSSRSKRGSGAPSTSTATASNRRRSSRCRYRARSDQASSREVRRQVPPTDRTGGSDSCDHRERTAPNSS